MARLRIGLILAVIGAGLIGQVGARQQRPEGGRPARPDFDIRANRSPAAASGRALAELSRRASAGEPGAARLHPHTGALRLLDAPGISSIPGASAAQLQALLQQFADRIGLDDDDVASLSAVRDYSSASTGLRHVTFAQSIDGLPVFGGIVSLHIAADGTIVRVTSSAARGAGRSQDRAVPAEAAVAAAAQDVTGDPFAPVRVDAGGATSARFARGRFRREIAASLEWFAMDGAVRLAWHVEIEAVPYEQLYDLLIDASSGELLLRRNRVLDAEGTGRVIQSDAVQAIDPRRPDPMPTGAAGCPPVINHQMRDLTAPFRDPATVLFNTGRLSGNNTHVFRGQPGTEGALGTFDGTQWLFDAPFGSAASAESALFFALNFAHDFFYDLGFNEAAGNFQENNFGRGGVGGDAIAGVARADGRNNATFQPEPEGTSPIISMFLWDGSGCWSQDVDGDGTVDLDGDYDSDIILHEFHHGVNHRLNTQFTGEEAGAIGEGGGDFFAYSLNGDTTLAEYSRAGGIRSINDKTYGDWLCLFGLFCEVHWNGEIWANVLWDLRERFRADLVGGSEAAAIGEVHQLYIDGLKLSPPAPTMLDTRDAMLLADSIRNPGSPNSQNFCRLWEPFAARGMGVNATDTADNGNGQVTEGFGVPTGCEAPPAAQVVTIAATAANAAEAGPVNGLFTVSRSVASSTALVVNLSVSGTATGGSDYAALALTATIPPDALSVAVPVVPIDDATVESNETVILRVVAGGYTIGSPSSATVMIASDDLAPDFSVSLLTVSETGAAGQDITVNDTTRNQGSGAGSPSTTSFYLSPNSTLDASDTPLGTRDVPALGPGATNAGTTTVTIPLTTSAGTFYVIAKADGPGLLTESSELNNTRYDSIRIGPDLVVSTLTVPASAGAGLQAAVPNTITNQGASSADASTVRFYLSTNYALDGTDTPLGARDVPQLSPGQASAVTTYLTIPANTLTGLYYVIAVADADTAVPESSDTNNTRYGTIRVGPDLQVSTLSVPDHAGVGSTISITDTTKNVGAGNAGGSRTAFYLSTNTGFDASDIPLGASRVIPALGPGAANSGTTTGVTLPATAGPGRWFVIAKADDLGQVAETQETNNTRYDIVDIGPDLGIYTMTAATSVVAGTSLTVTDTTRNYGADLAPPSTNRYYLSLNTSFDGSDILLSGQRDVPAIAYNTNNTGSAVVQIPAGMSGAYYLLVVADGNGAITEASETNNVKARALTINP